MQGKIAASQGYVKPRWGKRRLTLPGIYANLGIASQRLEATEARMTKTNPTKYLLTNRRRVPVPTCLRAWRRAFAALAVVILIALVLP